MSLDIRVIKGKRDGVRQTAQQKAYNLPPIGLTYIVGATGSGKTVSVCNLLQNRMLGSIYDKIYVFCMSPCSMLSDNCKKIEKEHIFINDVEGENLDKIIKTQEAYIEQNSFKKAPHILLIMDDVISSKKFMNNSNLAKLSFMGTHLKFSTWILSQDYHSLPKKIRTNAHAMMLFHGVKEREIDSFTDECQSCFMPRKEFIKMVKYAIEEPYSFLFFNCTNPNKRLAYRKKFKEILRIQ